MKAMRDRFGRMTKALSLTTLALICAAPLTARGQLIETKVVSLEAAKTMVAAAETEAKKHNWNMAIAIVDASGNLILFHRMDDVQLGSVDVAIEKARTAARFRRPTQAMADALKAGNQGILSIPGAAAIAGGVPITVDGKVIGAVGCSGMASDQDAVVAQAGVDALVAR
jgi:glc operon protein GlcG